MRPSYSLARTIKPTSRPSGEVGEVGAPPVVVKW